MDNARRRELARRLLDGYVSGPDAATEATAAGLERMGGARAVALVEGISDQIALETLAIRRTRDLEAEGVVVLPVGGVHAIARFLADFGPDGAGIPMVGMCDAGEEGILRRALAEAGLGTPQTRADVERLGFQVCVEDLEDELIRALGPPRVEALFDSQGDLGAFRSLQRQPAWRQAAVDAQMRRFLGAGSGRKLRYARLFVQSVDLDRVPQPLDNTLARV